MVWWFDALYPPQKKGILIFKHESKPSAGELNRGFAWDPGIEWKASAIGPAIRGSACHAAGYRAEASIFEIGANGANGFGPASCDVVLTWLAVVSSRCVVKLQVVCW